MSEAGAIEFFLLSSGSPVLAARKLHVLVGQPSLPPLWALGYHQCRWNYMNQSEVEEVSASMAQHQIPCDSVWLDIEYSRDKRYFLWDKNNFSKPQDMLQRLREHERRLVTIIDPHVKEDEGYFMFKEAKEKGLLVLNQEGKPYIGKCWPGPSAWLDFFNPETAQLLETLYAAGNASKLQQLLDSGDLDAYLWHSKDVGIWIDMNEPACFEQTDKTMPKGNLHKVAVFKNLEALDEG